MSDYSWFYGKPRSQVHYERFGTTAVPPRKYLRGGGRRVAAGGGDAGLLVLLGLLALLWMSKKR